MVNNVSTFISTQLPEHLRESAPLFLGFVETYYKFVEQRQNKSLYIQNISSNRDIDTTSDTYISEFYSTYGEYLPVELAADKRNFIKLLNDVYVAKGTEKALKLIFRAIFNEDISTTYPSKQILKASDGAWVRESFITVNVLWGSLSRDDVLFEFSNVYGNFSVNTTRIQYVAENEVRLFFRAYVPISIIDSQFITVKENGVSVFNGQIIKSPSTIEILHAGRDWQNGQVIIIPGTVKNTIARVSAVDSIGGIKTLEILEYGYDHGSNQSITISPYVNKPMGSVIDINSELTSINPNVYHHTIGITDFIDGVFENIQGISDSVSPNSYFLEDYVESTYSGHIVFSSSSTQSSSVSSILDAGITIEEWMASRSTLLYKELNVVNTKGYYADDSGKLSNQEIKTQDSYFYQAFSYLIETSKNLSEYKDLMNIVHPAGTKLFSSLSKTISYSPEFSSSRTISNDTVYHIDILSIDSANSLHFSKNVFDSALGVSDISHYSFNKQIIETVTSLDISHFYFGKSLNDSATSLDYVGRIATKPLVDSVSTTDSNNIANIKYLNVDSVSATDSNNIANIKYLNVDSVSVSSGSATDAVISSYADTYFAENYVEKQINITIG